MHGELFDVVGARAKRRDPERHDVEPVEKVLAEVALGGERLQIAVRSGDEADVGLERARAAEQLELPVLQHAQELHLHGGRDVADLVEEERSPFGELDAPRLSRHRSRERAFFVSE